VNSASSTPEASKNVVGVESKIEYPAAPIMK